MNLDMFYPYRFAKYRTQSNVIDVVFNNTLTASPTVETSINHNEKKLNEDLRWGVKPKRQHHRYLNWGV